MCDTEINEIKELEPLAIFGFDGISAGLLTIILLIINNTLRSNCGRLKSASKQQAHHISYRK